MNRFTVLALFLTLLSSVSAQNTSEYKEKLSLHSNSGEYSAGESILFSVLCMDKDNNLNPLCKTGYVLLVDDKGNSVLNVTVSIANGVGNGELVVPRSASSGNYKLIVYSDWVRDNDSDNIFEKEILISNTPSITTISNGSGRSSAEKSTFNYKEKVYIHSNSNEFFAGESILFSVFCLDYESNQAPLSKVAYVELIDDNGVSVFKTPVSINDGAGNGEFFVSSSLPTGNYHLIGYTKWMLNFGAQNVFQKKIRILNPFRTYINAKQEKSLKHEFYITGGRLIHNVPNQIRYTLQNMDESLSYTIKVIDDIGGTAYEGEAERSGSFVFVPDVKKAYKMILSSEGLQSGLVQNLPVVAGYGLSVITDLDNDQITFYKSNIDSKVRCTVANKNSDLFQADLKFANNKSVISTAEIGQAEIVNIRCESPDNNEVLANFFLNKTSFKSAVQKSALGTFGKRSPVKLELNELLEGIEPRTMSVSIRKENIVYEQDDFNITRYVNLDSELSPGSETLPILNSTSWDAEFQQRITPDFRGLTLQYDNEVEGLTFSSPGQRYYNTSFVDQTGTTNFIIDPSIYSNSYLAGSNEISRVKNNDVTQFTSLSTPEPLSLDLDYRDVKLIDERMVQVQVENMYAEKAEKDEAELQSFYGTPDKRFNLDEYTRFPTMDEVIVEILAGVRLRKSKEGLTLYLANSLGVVNREAPLILVNSIPVTDVNEVVNLDPLKIESVEVIREEYRLNESLYGGIIHFIPYKKDFFINNDFSISNSLIPYERSEAMLLEEAKSDSKPDYRSQLVWMLADENTRSIEFVTSDVTGEFVLNIQGISSGGTPFHLTKSFTVQD